MFPDLLHFAYELYLLATGRETWDVKKDLNSIQKWVGMNNMDLAMDKSKKLPSGVKIISSNE